MGSFEKMEVLVTYECFWTFKSLRSWLWQKSNLQNLLQMQVQLAQPDTTGVSTWATCFCFPENSCFLVLRELTSWRFFISSCASRASNCCASYCLTSRRPHLFSWECVLCKVCVHNFAVGCGNGHEFQALPSILVWAQHPMKTVNQAHSIWSWYPYPAEEV